MGYHPEKTRALASDPQSVLAANAYVEYDRYLKVCNVVDFDDLVLRPIELFRAKPDLLAKWQSKIRYFFSRRISGH